MDRSPVRYTRTSGGVNIGYTVRGSGPVLIEVATTVGGWNHLTSPAVRRYQDGLSQVRTVVSYDGGGYGESDRDLADVSLAAQLAELEAVVRALDAERFDLFGSFHDTPVVIAFAAARPEQVRRLVLWHPWASWRQFARYSTLPALRGMFDDWSLYAETAGRLLAGPDSDTAREMIDAILALDPAQVRRSLESRHQIEIEDVLPHVACPTLVLHRSGNPVTDVRASREVAARIPDARLLVLEGRGTIPPVGDDGAALRAIQSFLTEAEGAFAPPGTASPPSVGVSTPTTLTPREREVLGQIAEGKTNAQIAEQLVIAQNTVASHVKHILEKLEAANRTEAVRIATRLGLLQ